MAVPEAAQPAAQARYTLAGLPALLGLSRSVIKGLIDAGFVQPSRGPRRELRFSFQDVVLLRTAWSLQAAQIAPRRIVKALQQLRARLPAELPLTGLRIAAVGKEVAVWERDAPLQAESGQWLIDFEARAAPGQVATLARTTAWPAEDGAAQWFERGCALEASDPPQAEAAYRRAIALAPHDADAYLNLGGMLCEAGRCAEAVVVLAQGLAQRPDAALLHFNSGVALEDLGRVPQALAAYEASLRLQPDLADAHFNAARLHEQLGRSSRAIRHYSEYRRLQRLDR